MPIERSPHRTEDERTPGPSNKENHTLRHEEQNVEIQAHEFRNVKLSTFWRNRPKLWFAYLEKEIAAYRIRSDEIKYSTIIRHLDEQMIFAVADILEQPPETDKYNKLKNALIERFSDSLEKQLRILLKEMELGDRTPSTLLREKRTPTLGRNQRDRQHAEDSVDTKTTHENPGAAYRF